MRNYLCILTVLAITLTACRSSVKQQEDSVYSRHLQRHVALTVITTPMPKQKEDMNLLMFIGNSDDLHILRAKKIIDSLYQKKMIQPLSLVAFAGNEGDYGLEESGKADSKQFKQFNDFVIGELYPFVKKKVVIRKFHSFAICGFAGSALSALDIAWNNDVKIQRVGMFYPRFTGAAEQDSSNLETINSFRKRPEIKIYLRDWGDNQSGEKFKEIIRSKKSIAEFNVTTAPAADHKRIPGEMNFADFLIWAFPK